MAKKKGRKRYIAITGDFDSMSRDDAVRQIEAAGHVYMSEVTKKTTHVVIGSAPEVETILAASQEKAKIISEEKLLSIVSKRRGS